MKKLEFYTARYCGKCRAIKRRLNDLHQELSDIQIIFHDIDIERTLAKKNKIYPGEAFRLPGPPS